VLQPPRVQGLRVRAVTLTGGSANSSQPSDVAADPGGESEPIAVIDAVEALVNEEELVTPMELSALLAGSLPASKASPSAPGAEIAQPDDDAVLTIPAETRPQRDRALGKRQAAVMEYLRAHPNEPIPQRELCSRLGVSSSVVQSLVARGLLQATEVAMRRAPLALDDRPDLAPELTPFQGAAADALVAATRRGEGEALLLFGVTGSGKTEVYLHAIERARGAGRTAALLVPEISLTAQVASAVRRRLGERVAILHSALSEGERFDEWERLRKGEADVVVGPRSALFAPLKDPALIILDEEHDSSYKQDAPTPRYHAREVAMERARISRGCVVLGSATPSLESFHAALEGRHLLLELPERVRQRPLPAVEVVDLRTGPGARATTPRATVFSERLHDGIRERLDRGEQTILFLNRRGFSSFLLCRDCGYVPHCPSCDVSLTLHRQRTGVLLCHHCNYLQTAPESCRRCDSTRLRQFGLGTQRVEAEVRELFPAAKVARLDRDSVTGKDAHARIVQAVHDGEIDILVGTQMVTKGFDFPGVTLVGVVTADVALNMPDFRAGERAFQILTQVSGRAGRGDRAGEVVVQTFNPEHPSVQSASRHDYRGFFGAEIGHRKELGYPPFGSLARLVASHREDAVAQGRLEAAAGLLSPAVAQNEVQLLGPVSCPLGRLQDRYRRHLLLKGKDRAAIRAVLDVVWPEIQRRVGGIVVDVEPQSLM
jgi:primosomal protein N' (replication factor Y)